jgi:hypothetical protein
MRFNRRTLIIVAISLAAGFLAFWTTRNLVVTGSIEIIAAEYGVPGRTCSAGEELKKHVSMACSGLRPRCLVSVSTGWCGDPAPGVVKTLTVDYTCRATSKRATATDGTGLVLTCP